MLVVSHRTFERNPPQSVSGIKMGFYQQLGKVCGASVIVTSMHSTLES